MTKLPRLPDLQIASPCPASWAEMKGDDRARHCAACDKQVYNISAMTSEEVVALIERTEGHFCGRLYRRRDGSVLTADCPVGLAARAGRRVKRLVSLAAVGVGVLLTGGWLRGAMHRESSEQLDKSGRPLSLKEWISGAKRPQLVPDDYVIMGAIAEVPCPKPASVASANSAAGPVGTDPPK